MRWHRCLYLVSLYSICLYVYLALMALRIRSLKPMQLRGYNFQREIDQRVNLSHMPVKFKTKTEIPSNFTVIGLIEIRADIGVICRMLILIEIRADIGVICRMLIFNSKLAKRRNKLTLSIEH